VTPTLRILRFADRHASPVALRERHVDRETGGCHPPLSATRRDPHRRLLPLAGSAVLLLASAWLAWGDEPIPRPDDGSRDYRAKFAVIVGIDGYPDAGSDLARLQYAANDAREFRRLLVGEFGYDDAHILYLTDAENEPKAVVDGKPTIQAIRDAFEKWLPSRGLGPDDSVVFFFAGHGLHDPATGEGYLAAADSRSADRAGSCLAVKWLRDRLGRENRKAVPCRHRLVLLDCCYSGTLFSEPLVARPVPPEGGRPGGAGAGPPPPTRGERPGPARGSGEVGYYLSHEAFVGMTAGLGDQPVADGTGRDRHSFFTRELLQAMRERAALGRGSDREDHVFTFTELASVVRSRVATAVLRLNPLLEQIPMTGRVEAGQGDFVFRQSVDVDVPWEQDESRRLARLSDSERPKHLDRSFLLSVEALRIAQTPEARDSLYSAFTNRPGIISFFHAASGLIRSPTFSPDSTTLAAAYDGGGGVILWDVRQHLKPQAEIILVPEGDVWGIAYSPDGRTLAAGYAGDAGGGVVLWDVGRRTRVQPGPLPVPEGPARSLAFSSDGQVLAVGCSRAGGGVVLWDVGRRARVQPGPLPVPEGSVTGVAFDPDGRTLAAAYTELIRDIGGVVLFDARRRARVQPGPLPVPEGSATAVAFGPDGRTLAAGYWRLGGGPDGRLGDGLGAGGGVVLWDVGRRARVQPGPLPVPEGSVTGVAFGPDGRTLAASYAGDDDGGVVLFDVQKFRRLQTKPLATRNRTRTIFSGIWSAPYSPDGKILAANFSDLDRNVRNVVLLDASLRSWTHRACRIANRNLTWDEWRRYFPETPYRRTVRTLPWPRDLPDAERRRAEAFEKEHYEGDPVQ
jgi:WD40 repeat protein